MESNSVLGKSDNESANVIEEEIRELSLVGEDKVTEELCEINELNKVFHNMIVEENQKLELLVDNLTFEEAKYSPPNFEAKVQQILQENEEKRDLLKYLETCKCKRRQAEDEINQLEAKVKSLEASLASLIAEESKTNDLDRQKKIALEKAVSKYKSVFDFSVEICNESESVYEAHLKFTSTKIVKPLIIRIDKIARQITDMDVSDLLPEEIKQELLRKYNDPKDVPKLFCAIREFLIDYS